MNYPTVVYWGNPQYPSGVDLWRAITPAREAATLGYGTLALPLGHDIPTFNGEWPEVAVYNQRGSTKPGTTLHARQQIWEPHNVLMVADVCDDPEPDYDNPLKQRGKPIRRGWSKGFTPSELVVDHIKDVHLVTVNSEEMARICRRYNRHVEVIPDLIAPNLWHNLGRPPDRANSLTIGVAGGDTHGKDWRILVKVWKVLAAKYDWLQFVNVGHQFDFLKKAVPFGRFKEIGFTNLINYQANYRYIDIGCAPLDDIKFNRSKSPIKFYEYSLGGAATVASPVVYGAVIKDGLTGYVASTVDEWIEKITDLIENPTKRRVMIEDAQRDVLTHYSLTSDHIEQRMAIYAKHYSRVYRKPPTGLPAVRRKLLSSLSDAIQATSHDRRRSQSGGWGN